MHIWRRTSARSPCRPVVARALTTRSAPSASTCSSSRSAREPCRRPCVAGSPGWPRYASSFDVRLPPSQVFRCPTSCSRQWCVGLPILIARTTPHRGVASTRCAGDAASVTSGGEYEVATSGGERRVPLAPASWEQVEQSPRRAHRVDPPLATLLAHTGRRRVREPHGPVRVLREDRRSTAGCRPVPRCRGPPERARVHGRGRRSSQPRSRACARSAPSSAAATTTTSACWRTWRATPLKPSIHIVHIGRGLPGPCRT